MWRLTVLFGLGGFWAIGGLLVLMALGTGPVNPPLIAVGGLCVIVGGWALFWPEIRRD
jgi:hypothetical protein